MLLECLCQEKEFSNMQVHQGELKGVRLMISRLVFQQSQSRSWDVELQALILHEFTVSLALLVHIQLNATRTLWRLLTFLKWQAYSGHTNL